MLYPETLQQLPARLAHLCLNIESRLLELEPRLKGASLLLGCSGGVDSIALAHMLRCISVKNGFTLHLAHLDHGLREQSADDMFFVQRMAEDMNTPCTAEHVDVAAHAQREGMGLEEAGRACRYRFFESVRQRAGCDWIVLAHHLDDLTEDMLLRLIRGTGWPGLAGMHAKDNARRLLRPLLQTPKAALREFLQELHIPWTEDESNTSRDFARNRVRHDILSGIVTENINFSACADRLHRQATLDRDYFDQSINAVPVQRLNSEILIRRDTLRDTHPAIRMRLYKTLLDELGPGQVLADSLRDLDRAVSDDKASRPRTFQFPGGKTALLEADTLTFRSGLAKQG